MKKLFFGALASVGLLVASCESDDSTTVASNALRVSKITETIYIGDEIQPQVTNFNYDASGQILQSVSTPNATTTFDYGADDVIAAHRVSTPRFNFGRNFN
jgi:YD repeat-containing protein